VVVDAPVGGSAPLDADGVAGMVGWATGPPRQ
jgi:hypothetical protein